MRADAELGVVVSERIAPGSSHLDREPAGRGEDAPPEGHVRADHVPDACALGRHADGRCSRRPSRTRSGNHAAGRSSSRARSLLRRPPRRARGRGRASCSSQSGSATASSSRKATIVAARRRDAGVPGARIAPRLLVGDCDHVTAPRGERAGAARGCDRRRRRSPPAAGSAHARSAIAGKHCVETRRVVTADHDGDGRGGATSCEGCERRVEV